jgi:hypothetical protein
MRAKRVARKVSGGFFSRRLNRQVPPSKGKPHPDTRRVYSFFNSDYISYGAFID